MKNVILLSSLLALFLISCEKQRDMGIQSGANTHSANGGMNGNIGNYAEHEENPFQNVSEKPFSTFSVDADGASYANIRRFILEENTKPPMGAVRTEELINYFNLDYPYNNTNHPIDLNGEVSRCPWNSGHKLIRVGIKGKPLPNDPPPSNFVFLIDVSGSMQGDDRLGLLKRGFKQFVDDLNQEDRVAIVTYAGSDRVALRSTPGDQKEKIKSAINSLGAGGSTAGSEGIKTAYSIAERNLIKDGNNRVILGSDGDFNVGVTSKEKLINLIEEKRDKGIFLTTIGVGRGNLNDASMEQIANHGNGTYEYIDNVKQLKKVFIYDQNKFYTVAKDVKVQVEFNKQVVDSYRLIGYENRTLDKEDFKDDSTDAGEIGAGQNVTALYEIKPVENTNFKSYPTFTIDFRYKDPDAQSSQPMELKVYDEGNTFQKSSDFMKFTASVASYSMLLSNSTYKGNTDYNKVLQWLNNTSLKDPHGFKSEFQELVRATRNL